MARLRCYFFVAVLVGAVAWRWPCHWLLYWPWLFSEAAMSKDFSDKSIALSVARWFVSVGNYKQALAVLRGYRAKSQGGAA